MIRFKFLINHSTVERDKNKKWMQKKLTSVVQVRDGASLVKDGVERQSANMLAQRQK